MTVPLSQFVTMRGLTMHYDELTDEDVRRLLVRTDVATEKLWTVQVVTQGTQYKDDIPWHYSYQVPTFYVTAFSAIEATAKALDILPDEGIEGDKHITHNVNVAPKEQ